MELKPSVVRASCHFHLAKSVMSLSSIVLMDGTNFEQEGICEYLA